MDGLECREVNFSETLKNKDWRIDSAFFTAKIYRNPAIEYAPIGNYLLDTQYGMSISMNEEGDGCPIYRMNEIHNMLCDLEAAKYARVSAKEFQKFKLNDGDVLFNRTNSYEWVGRTGIFYETGTQQIFASYLVRLIPDKSEILPEYLTAFLSSCYGVSDIKRRSRQSINQTNVNPEEIKEILIPLLSMDTQLLIKKCFLKAHQSRLNAKEMYTQAEQLLLSAFDADDFSISQEPVSVKSFSDSFVKSGRLDAEYYQPKYDDYKNLLKTTNVVSSLCHIYDRNFKPSQEVEYKYIELANVGSSGNITDVETILGKELPSRARRQVQTGQVIIASVEGSLQSCALITEEYHNALCSTGFYVLDSESINSETLLVLFKSEPIQALLKQRCSGTILTAITRDELMDMPLPEIDKDVQTNIAEKIQASFAYRSQSEKLLKNAKRAVEIAIEQGEEHAVKWLKERE